MKKNFFYILAYTLLLGIGGCSDDDEPIVPKELKIFSMTPTEGVAGGDYHRSRIQHCAIREHRHV